MRIEVPEPLHATSELDRAGSPEEPPEPRWRALVSRIRTIQMELKRRAPERRVGLAGNPAAPENAIRVAELRLGRRLPPSYREFLAFSDGWPHFFENASLLGTTDIGRARAREESSPGRSSRLLPFGVDDRGSSLFAFDTALRRADGEMPVVAWIGGLGIDCRCFTSFLATALQLCRSELAAQKAVENPGREGPEQARRARDILRKVS